MTMNQMLQRNIIGPLSSWLTASHRKPLILRGARQIGKTSIIRALAAKHNMHLLELNFEKMPALEGLFASNDVKKIIMGLEVEFECEINLGNTLLFLDEIQTVPALLAKLRWFAEDMPQLAVVAAGSLLEFVLAEHDFSMPVGRITYMHMEPMSFEEFLLAKGGSKAYEFLQSYQWDNIPEVIHQQLLNAFKEYLIIGGMPAVVASWANKASLLEVDRLKHDLIATYRDDFSKYAKRISPQRFEELLSAIPHFLGRKFIYSHVNRDISVASIKNALQLLVKARICHPVHCTHANGVPLAAEKHNKQFKIVSLDVGLVCTSLGINLNQVQSINDINLINGGALSEQVVGQLLRTISPEYIEPSLYYWSREQKGSAAEVDYIIQHANDIIPIEVKSGKTGSLKSLHLFMQSKPSKHAVRVNSDHPSRVMVDVKLSNHGRVQYPLLSIPFYLLGQLNRLLAME